MRSPRRGRGPSCSSAISSHASDRPDECCRTLRRARSSTRRRTRCATSLARTRSLCIVRRRARHVRFVGEGSGAGVDGPRAVAKRGRARTSAQPALASRAAHVRPQGTIGLIGCPLTRSADLVALRGEDSSRGSGSAATSARRCSPAARRIRERCGCLGRHRARAGARVCERRVWPRGQPDISLAQYRCVRAQSCRSASARQASGGAVA